MVYKNNVPQPGDFLTVSQGDLLGNFSQLDTSFGIDHYTYSNLTADNGKHNQVTTPIIVGAAHPVTAANEPKFYAMEDSGTSTIGVLQYSRGPSNAVPSPVTLLQSASGTFALAFGTPVDLVNLDGTARVCGTVYASDYVNVLGMNAINFAYAPGFLAVMTGGVVTPSMALSLNGTILQLSKLTAGTFTTVAWSIKFHRIEV